MTDNLPVARGRLWVVLAALFTACGGGGSGGATCPPPELVRSMDAVERSAYQRTERCTGLTAPEPAVHEVPNEPCSDGRMCCVSAERSARGTYYGRCYGGLIVLPAERDGCPDDVPHEAIHHLLAVNTGDPDGGYGRAEWGCV